MIRNTGDDASSRTTSDDTHSGTHAGAEATGRMTGIHNTDDRPVHHGDDHDERAGEHRREERVETSRPTDRVHGVKPAKTSAAATFGLVFGLAALFCALTAILAPAAILFGIIGFVVAAAGRNMARRPGVTGKGIAIGGLITSTLGLLLGAAVLAGAAVVVNDEQRLNQIETQLEDLRADLPSAEQITSEISG